jgi:FKBP-type peptidyl-prolyl cis-trans isomerase
MKRISMGLFLTFLGLIIFSACQENVSIDWKLANDRFYASLEDSLKYYSSTKYTSLPDSVKKINPPMQKSADVSAGINYYYKVIFPGWNYSRQPNSGSGVKVTYKGSLIDGLVFDSNSAGIWLSLSGTIAGWREIIPKLHNGANIKLYLPSALAYDTVSTNPTIPPHSVLIFDINLLDSSN